MVDANPITHAGREHAVVDSYLAACLKSGLRFDPLPAWTADLDCRAEEVASRVSFHGIALLLWEHDPAAAGWPLALVNALRHEAAGQSFWEERERREVGGLIEALADAGASAIVLKGTALAYSLYSNPAVRRRGDTDILVLPEHAETAKRVLSANGFEREGDRLMFQEVWTKEGRGGFVHTIDLHWRIDGSATVSSNLERAEIAAMTEALPKLSPRARGLAPLANLLLVCLNRAEHEVLGYFAGGERIFDGDRLIWTSDVDAICASFSDTEWALLPVLAQTSGSARYVLSGLEFAHRSVGTRIPPQVWDELAREPGAHDLNTYLTTRSTIARLRLEIAATPRVLDKLRHLKRALAPGAGLLRERFPEHRDWPIAVLRARRLVGGLLKAMKEQV